MIRETLENVKLKMKSKTYKKKIDTNIYKEIKPTPIKMDKPKYYLNNSSIKYNFENILLKQCAYFPSNTLHAVNCILNLKIRKSYNKYELKG